MVNIIAQQGWSELIHVTIIGIDEIKDFHTVRDDGAFDAKPIAFHLKCFLLFYRRKSFKFNATLTKDDAMDITKELFQEYCGSNVNIADLATASLNLAAATTPAFGTTGIVNTDGTLPAQEYRRGARRTLNSYRMTIISICAIEDLL
jgi:hypothetical protein